MARLEVVCRRLPFTSTSVWLGLRPRILACSVWFAMSPPNACAVNDGTTFARALMRSGFPALSAHVMVGRDDDCHAVRRNLEALLEDRFGLHHTTLQVDHEGGELLSIEAPRE